MPPAAPVTTAVFPSKSPILSPPCDHMTAIATGFTGNWQAKTVRADVRGTPDRDYLSASGEAQIGGVGAEFRGFSHGCTGRQPCVAVVVIDKSVAREVL